MLFKRFVLLTLCASLAACSTGPDKQNGSEPQVSSNAPVPSSKAVASPPPMSPVRSIAPPSADMAASRVVQGAAANSHVYVPPSTAAETYEKLPENSPKLVAESPVSTFSIDVDTGAYANMRRFINSGSLPRPDAVRLEELVNYFPYEYAVGNAQHPFGVQTELMQTPWNPDSYLLRIGIQAQDKKLSDLPPANLVFLVDVSGSMSSPMRLDLVKSTLTLLTEQLRAQDKVAIVTYSGTTSVPLPATSGADKNTILNAISQLRAAGSTAGGSGIDLAYKIAQDSFMANGINRIIMTTDGDFNVGVSDFATLKTMVEEKRKTGISLTTLGYGVDNYNEMLMEQLADAGNGNYAYIDGMREARKVLNEELVSTLYTVAKDVKLQVEFNPSLIAEYRLLGYENRQLAREDFNNDKVDAGEIGAGRKVTAIYEIVPVGKTGWITPLRYAPATQAENNAAKEFATVNIRYQPPAGGASRLLSLPVSKQTVGSVSAASSDFRFAAAVAAFAQQLKGGRYIKNFTWDDTLALAKGAVGTDEMGLRAEFVQLVETVKRIQPAIKPAE